MTVPARPLHVDDFTTDELMAIAGSVLDIVNSINRRTAEFEADEGGDEVNPE